MNIVYVAPLAPGSVSQQRLEILKQLGHDVIAIDNASHHWRVFSVKGFARQLSSYLDYPLDLEALNRRILQHVRSTEVDLLWIDKGLMVYPKTLKKVREAQPTVKLVNFNPDDPFYLGARGWGWFKKCIPHYDYCFVPRKISVKEYLDAGARKVKRFYWGYSPSVHRPIEVTPEDRLRLGGEVGFIGSYERPRAEMLFALQNAGVPTRIWGDWNRRDNSFHTLKTERRCLWGDEFTRGICSFDINLCFLNKQNRDTLNTRSIAIPACGKFMLAERTGDLAALFKEGVEAEFFGSPEELIDKTKYYLRNDEARRKIGEAGFYRCQKDGYSNAERLKGLLDYMTTECS